MRYRLLISRGRQEGQQVVVFQPEFTIGREAADLILLDSGVSAHHARLVSVDGRVVIEDLGSSNGTQVNGVRVEGPQPLAPGDAIALGTALLAFLDASAGDSNSGVPHVEVTQRDLPRLTGPLARPAISDLPTALAPAVAATVEVTSRELEATHVGRQKPLASVETTRSVEVPPPLGLIRAPLAAATAREVGVEPTAAERYRRRREGGHTLGAQLGQLWFELSPPARAGLAGALFAAAVSICVGLYQFFAPSDAPVLPPEPDSLAFLGRLGNSFGCGSGVDYVDCDQKVFNFELRAPTAVALLVHFQALDISADAVRVSVNGADLAAIPADVGIPDREIELLAPPQLLKRDQRNTLTFDNVKNPPGTLPWQVRNVGIELVPVPELGSAEAVSRASGLQQQAEQLYKARAAGADNVFAAWRKFREAWILLLGQREPAAAALTLEVKQRADALRDELDRLCGQLLLDARKQIELKNPDRAREILEEVPQYFPSAEHRCHDLARERLVEYQDL